LTTLSTQLRDAQARGKGMEEALKPFARLAAKWHSAFRDTDAVSGANLTVGDLRRAQRAISSDPLSRPEGSAST